MISLVLLTSLSWVVIRTTPDFKTTCFLTLIWKLLTIEFDETTLNHVQSCKLKEDAFTVNFYSAAAVKVPTTGRYTKTKNELYTLTSVTLLRQSFRRSWLLGSFAGNDLTSPWVTFGLGTKVWGWSRFWSHLSAVMITKAVKPMYRWNQCLIGSSLRYANSLCRTRSEIYHWLQIRSCGIATARDKLDLPVSLCNTFSNICHSFISLLL